MLMFGFLINPITLLEKDYCIMHQSVLSVFRKSVNAYDDYICLVRQKLPVTSTPGMPWRAWVSHFPT